ncbi:hypothetical protein BKA57DRAFT_444926 [Linnemannia elongata]|nr:hypothetical protein BKA57DRAFT_444926 [Linnemannia elongata]
MTPCSSSFYLYLGQGEYIFFVIHFLLLAPRRHLLPHIAKFRVCQVKARIAFVLVSLNALWILFAT